MLTASIIIDDSRDYLLCYSFENYNDYKEKFKNGIRSNK